MAEGSCEDLPNRKRLDVLINLRGVGEQQVASNRKRDQQDTNGGRDLKITFQRELLAEQISEAKCEDYENGIADCVDYLKLPLMPAIHFRMSA
jgi:hypothetical protein